MFRTIVRKFLRPMAYEVVRARSPYPITIPIVPFDVAVLEDPAFIKSCEEVAPYTLLDTSRLANLWQLCRMSNPQGGIIEIGTYKGGGALHLSNCCPERKMIVCDSFSGFETIDGRWDGNFDQAMFKDTRKELIEALFKSRGRTYEIVPGFFPQSCQDRELGPVSFAHIDVDIYKATIESLHYLHEIMTARSLIVLDDYFRKTEGVNQAVQEFVRARKEWACFPLFPGQGLLIHVSWF